MLIRTVVYKPQIPPSYNGLSLSNVAPYHEVSFLQLCEAEVQSTPIDPEPTYPLEKLGLGAHDMLLLVHHRVRRDDAESPLV